MAANSLELQAHELIGSLDPDQLAAVVHLLKVMIDEDDELTEEDRAAFMDSREYFRHNPDGGIPFEKVVAECGFTMDQIRKAD